MTPYSKQSVQSSVELRSSNTMTRAQQESQIVNFYNNKSVLITGGTGFLGKVLIEKLLRTCTSILHIYVLIRPKREKQPEERLRELLKEPLFDEIRRQNQNDQLLLDKVIAVEGDVSQINLGLSGKDLARIVDEVSVIYHSAATIKFDAPLKESVAINLIGTKNIVRLARKLTKLAALVHVSTAYSNCDKPEIDEHVYPVDVNVEKFIDLSCWMDQDTLQELKPKLLQISKKPNTYAYTKALAEWLLLEEAADLPVVVCRPSIICSSWKEPFSGWIDGLAGPTGLVIVTLKGVIRSIYGDPSCRFDIVPVDLVSNMIVSLGWFAYVYHGELKGKKMTSDLGSDSLLDKSISIKFKRLHQNTVLKLKEKNLSEEIANIPVFHCTSKAQKPLTNQMFAEILKPVGRNQPSIATYRYPSFDYTKNWWLDQFYQLTLHDIPAYLIDFILKLTGGRPILVKIVDKCKKSSDVLTPFITRQWNFDSTNSMKLSTELMSEEDRQLFNCNMSSLDWNDYLKDYLLGIRKFILKEPEENIEQARANLKIVYYRNTILQLLSLTLLVYFILPFNLFEW